MSKMCERDQVGGGIRQEHISVENSKSNTCVGNESTKCAESAAYIKKRLSTLSPDEWDDFIRIYSNDARNAVQALVKQAEKKKAALLQEKERTKRMYFFEEKYRDLGWICGIDEVGRGPLAGPVCAGAVILPADEQILYLNDSKKLSEKRREEMVPLIRAKAVAYATAFVSPERIDEINILQATYEAMTAAVHALSERFHIRPNVLLIDAVHIPQLADYKQVSIVKGDAQSASIAAASIVAKVERDRLMKEYDKTYPVYGFAGNKGYGSAAHIEALRKYGPCQIHRNTFVNSVLSH